MTKCYSKRTTGFDRSCAKIKEKSIYAAAYGLERRKEIFMYKKEDLLGARVTALGMTFEIAEVIGN